MRFLLRALTLSLIATSAVLSSACDVECEWRLFKSDFGKSYLTESEELRRLAIFGNNLQRIDRLNSEQNETIFGITSFADMELGEHTALHDRVAAGMEEETGHVPAPVNITKRANKEVVVKYVTSAKQQGSCGSCAVFAVGGLIEQVYNKAKGRKVATDISEQALMNCVPSTCKAGWRIEDVISKADQWSAKKPVGSYGVPSEKNCQYQSCTQCPVSPKPYTRISGRIGYASGNSLETSIRSRIDKGYSVVASICTAADNGKRLGDYKGGIFDIGTCHKDYPGWHTVLIVGYGDGYWIAKNSWGSWGLGAAGYQTGFFKLKKDVNSCNIRGFKAWTTTGAA